ncbi:MAG: c-type cytochrome [Chloroflexi bacterium]|nr:c-type cytochrome [Chloroflexota bacterium]
MLKRALLLAALGVLGLTGLAFLAEAAPPRQATAAPLAVGDPAKGGYLARLGGCAGCHGQNYAGQRADGTAGAPFGITLTAPGGGGTAPASNITPDAETGIGRWSDAELVRAIRDGIRPDGKVLYPGMPYARWHTIADDDMEHLVAFLRSNPAVQNKPPARQLQVEPAQPRFSAPSPKSSPGESAGRGEILITVANCANCHTPRTAEGTLDPSKYLAGNILGTGATAQAAANITPDRATGIGDWTVEQIATAIKLGRRPNGTALSGAMATQINNRFQFLSDTDARAVALYLKSIPAVQNRPAALLPAPAAMPRTGDDAPVLPMAGAAGLGALALGLGWLGRRRASSPA